jgi:ribonuclease P protein subunit POP4
MGNFFKHSGETSIMITPENLARHELIGLACRVRESSNRALIGLEGRVVDESRQTLTLEIRGREKSLIKSW